MSLQKTNNKGFTLIELVIVLAIAALIIAAVLVAVRGAQQSRRDSARRDSASQMGALLEEWEGNHSGNVPTGVGAGATQINAAQINGKIRTPDGGNFNVTFAGAFGTCPNTLAQDTMQVVFNGRRWQVAVGLDGGNAAFCAND